MKYAICYRGISYKENYFNEPGLNPYNVDFYECLPSNKKYLIDPLKEKGNEVDVFYNTYDSPKLKEYIDELNPANVCLSEFNSKIQKYNFPHVTQLIINSLEQIKKYQLENDIMYDYIILTRFDIYLLNDFSEIYLPENAISVPTRTNTGNFNRRRLKSFIKVVKKFGLMSKEHNGDYLTDSFDVELRFETGLDAINIAPEFGQIESEYYLEECKKNEELFDELYRMCYNSGKWKKWIKDINRISKGELIMTCCHYILSDELFIKKIKSQFLNSDQLIQKRINSKLKLLNEQTKNYCF